MLAFHSFARSAGWRYRCGDHAISRGVLGLSFQGPRGAGAPCSGVAVSSSGSLCCPEFFFGASRFFSVRYSDWKEVELFSPFWLPKFPSGEPVRAGQRCLAASPSTAPWEAPSRERLYGLSLRPRQVLSIAFDRFFNLIHKLWISRGGSLLIGGTENGPGAPRISLVGYFPGAAGLAPLRATGRRFSGTRAPSRREGRDVVDEPGRLVGVRVPPERCNRGRQAVRAATLSMNQTPRGSRTRNTSAPEARRAR